MRFDDGKGGLKMLLYVKDSQVSNSRPPDQSTGEHLALPRYPGRKERHHAPADRA